MKKNIKKITLYQRVSTLDEFIKVSKRGYFPLVIVLDEVEYGVYKQDKSILQKLYHQTHLLNDGSSNRYMLLSGIKLTENIVEKKINVKNFIDQEGNKNIVACIIPANRSKKEVTKIKFLDEKDNTTMKTITLHDLQMSVGKEYINEDSKIKVYTNNN